MIIRFKFGPPSCIYCGSNDPPKLYGEGALVHEGQIVWRYRGVVHEKCVSKLREEAACELRIPTTV